MASRVRGAADEVKELGNPGVDGAKRTSYAEPVTDKRQLALAAAVALSALTLAGAVQPAGAEPAQIVGPTPTLGIDRTLGSTGKVETGITVGLSTSPAAATPGRVAVYVPSGYQLALGRLPAGSPLGAVFLGQTTSTGTRSAGFGQILVADPAAYASDPGAQACDPDPHLAVWKLHVQLADTAQTVDLPLFVDQPTATDPPSAGFRLQLCPSSADGVRLFVLDLELAGSVLAEPTSPATYVWRAHVTPLLPGAAALDPAHTFEVRALVPLPQTLTLQARYDAKRKAAILGGQLTELGRPKAGASIEFFATSEHVDFADFGPAKTNTQGKYSFEWPIKETTRFSAAVDEADPSDCTGPSTAPGGCVSSTVSTPPEPSAEVRLPRATDPKRSLSRADQALARQVNLKLSDLPAGWEADTSGDNGPSSCTDFRPDESKLTLTGTSVSPDFTTGSPGTPTSLQAASAVVKVWRTPADAQAAFNREARIGQIQCIRDAIRSANDPSITLVAFGRLGFPSLGRGTRAFRLELSDNREGGVGKVVLDLVVILGRRTTVLTWFTAVGQPSPLERPLSRVLAARAARG